MTDLPMAAATTALATVVAGLLASGRVDDATDFDIASALTALGKLYAAKAEQNVSPALPVAPDALTATETVTLVSGLLRAANLNVFDFAMWFRRAS